MFCSVDFEIENSVNPLCEKSRRFSNVNPSLWFSLPWSISQNSHCRTSIYCVESISMPKKSEKTWSEGTSVCAPKKLDPVSTRRAPAKPLFCAAKNHHTNHAEHLGRPVFGIYPLKIFANRSNSVNFDFFAQKKKTCRANHLENTQKKFQPDRPGRFCY